MSIFRIFLIAVIASVTGGLNAQATVVDVFAQANSSTGGSGAITGFNINIGDRLVMVTDIDDCWSAGGGARVSNADGLVSSSGTCQPSDAFALYTQNSVSAPYGSLMGKIGAGNFFFVGTAFDQIMAEGGALSLYYWDSNNYDNSGSVAVNIAVNPRQGVPEPGILGMGALGFGLLLFRRRRS